ncbi:hypothetical protein ACWCPM_05665 [Streptomyces sp. NPDC002309]
MPGPYGKPLDSVHSSHYMRHWTNRTSAGNERFLLEIYTGWVQCDIAVLDTTQHFTVKTFLPVTPGQVRFYSGAEPGKPGSIDSFTVVASPGALAPFEDEATVFAVDSADVQLESQFFTGAGSQKCLVLNAILGLLNCRMFNYTYSVHVLTVGEPTFNVSPIPTNQRPAGGANPEGNPVN